MPTDAESARFMSPVVMIALVCRVLQWLWWNCYGIKVCLQSRALLLFIEQLQHLKSHKKFGLEVSDMNSLHSSWVALVLV